MINNLYNPAKPEKATAWNSQLSYCATSGEVEAEDRQAAENRIAEMIATTKKGIATND